MKFETKAIHAGYKPDPTTGAITPPIYQTATYVLPELGVNLGYDYSRTSNPTRTVLETLVANLEGSQYGIAFSTGMAAVDAVIRARLKADDHVVVFDDAYGGVYRLFEQSFRKYKLDFTYVDMRDSKTVKEAIKENTKLVWLETPTNPLLKVADVEAICNTIKTENIHRENDQKILSAIDNTFMTPFYLKPFNFGADIIVHSTTKFLSGHNQLVGGIVVVRDNPKLWYYEKQPISSNLGVPSNDHTELVNTVYQDIKFIQNAVGAVPGPMDCWLSIMGIKTLHIRMERHNSNALKIIDYLKNHPKVSKIYYPGLPTHENHSIAKQQMTGFGGMISFELTGGLDAGRKLMNSVKLWSLAESLGAVESMITHPASMTHSSVPEDVRRARGISDGLVRLSVGIEAVEDLIADLEQGFSILKQ
ncbi:MAG: trans-sulfuration enzyme family protein [Candidatus Hodarchaeales archaeon]|jgi:cystathionine beta-lyase/cystathionine gamma-synthase